MQVKPTSGHNGCSKENCSSRPTHYVELDELEDLQGASVCRDHLQEYKAYGRKLEDHSICRNCSRDIQTGKLCVGCMFGACLKIEHDAREVVQ